MRLFATSAIYLLLVILQTTIAVFILFTYYNSLHYKHSVFQQIIVSRYSNKGPCTSVYSVMRAKNSKS